MSNVTQTCRDINELKPNAKLACQLLFQECYKAGIKDIFITETYRSQERQKYLYEQGRSRKYDTKGNKLSVVTWTLNSNHTPRLAWDIAVCPPKSLYDISTLNKVGTIAKKLGIEWGGYWKSPNYDAPHFQVSSKWNIPKGYSIEGVIKIPTNSKDRIEFTSNKVDYTRKLGYSAPKDSKAYRIHTDSYNSKLDAEKAKLELVKQGFIKYAEVFGNDKNGYRLQTGKYNSQKEAEQVALKLLEAKKIGYASIIGSQQ